MSGYRVIVKDVSYMVPPGETLVGRSDACGIVVKHNSVSRLHAALRLTSGALTIEDLGSRNGTAVNGRRIEGHTELRAGDVVILGQMVIDVVEGDPSVRALAPTQHQVNRSELEGDPATEKVTADAVKRVVDDLEKKKLSE
ncbi:MAG: FHA domain-containing protein [Myxococcales bacterium]|nr:MAG: FHA domain-containing protein [Myxococcales bacterium]